MSLDQARAADRNGEIVLAASLYEEVVALEAPSLPVLMDLAVLYWQATDPGIASAKHLSPVFLATAGRRVSELLKSASRRFPESTDVEFWRAYIAWADSGGDLSIDQCRALLERDPKVLVPAMYIFSASNGRELESKARELLSKSRREETTRGRYITSVIEGVIRRAASDGERET